jgi:voltage-gated potassium channel Kch
MCLGLFFAFTYRGIGLWQVEPFFGAQGRGTTSDCAFFSMTTLTTTGYGNLVPARNPGQSIAVLEMVSGQLFLLAAVGKVLADMPARRRRAGEPDS